jgi:hypothetical protein
MFRSVLLATQSMQFLLLISCTKPSHSSVLVFAMAKATQFQQGRRGAPTTRASIGSSNAGAFAAHCCWR